MGSLNETEIDVLMKYTYRGLAKGENCGPLLKLHASLVEKAGIGCIVRVMAERNRV